MEATVISSLSLRHDAEQRPQRASRFWSRCALLVALAFSPATALAELHMPPPDRRESIIIEARLAAHWTEGLYSVRLLSEGVTIRQGKTIIDARQAVVFTDTSPEPGKPRKVIIYAEGSADAPVAMEVRAAPDAPPVARQLSPEWFGTFFTDATIEWRSPPPSPAEATRPEIASRALAKLRGADSDVQQAQFQAPGFPPPVVVPPGPAIPNSQGFREIIISKRSEVGANLLIQPQANGETVMLLTEGFNVVVQGFSAEGIPKLLGDVQNLDLEFDRAVVWTAGNVSGSSFRQENGTPLEIYMEGNIVFREGDRIVYADRMYYDVRSRTGVILNAELLTPLPDIDGNSYRGLVRLKAGMLRQLDATRFVATDALFTSSRLEEPSYHLGAETISFEDVQQPVIDPLTGQQAVIPATGEPIFAHERLATARDTRVFLGGVPVFWWPKIATDLNEPTYFVSDLTVGNDDIFGFQFLLDLDVYQLLGTRAPQGTDWDLSLDYLSQRGFGYGTKYKYEVDSFFGHNGPAIGRTDFWAISDSGHDNLGFLRRDLIPTATYRGRAFWNHRQKVTDGLLEGWIAQAEVGWISDRTFLEQYYEAEWDDNKDQSTGARFKRLFYNQSISIEANAQINEFFTQTEWLPRLDHYIMGQDLLGESLTWFGHSQAAYANYGVAVPPPDPLANLGLSTFTLFPWEADVQGERLASRQELDLPIDAEPFKIVPYALGEVAHWGADIDGNDIDRAYVHTGVRASIPFWAVNPAIRDPLFNLNGLAHKVVFDAELSYTDANQNFDSFPLYDEIEDNALQETRRMWYDPSFAPGLAGLYNAATGAIDPRVDPRVYAIRSGIHGLVSSPTTELVEDQAALRLGMRHRLQTKRGAFGNERIIDWLTFDSNATWFPNDAQDNFNQPFGLIDYDLRWHVGDRVTLLSDGFADTFEYGLKTVSGGVMLNRPTIGNFYLGYRTARGPFSADLITATINYRMSPKWIGSASTMLDFSEAGNIGQTFLLSRLGEATIFSLGVNADQSKGNVGFNLSLEPRFLPRLNLTRRTGIDIPPAGAYGLE